MSIYYTHFLRSLRRFLNYRPLKKGPLVWCLLLGMIILYFVPYIQISYGPPSQLQAYRMLALVPTVLVGIFRGRKGAFISFGLLTLMMYIIMFLQYRLSWPVDATSSYIFGTIGGLLVTAVVGQFFHMATQLSRAHDQLQSAHDDLQAKNSDLERLNTQLEALATFDPITELPNHRALVEAIDKELARSQRSKKGCGLLFLDIDHFKALNDGYGHPAGDNVLREFGRLIKQELRSIDTVGRWGGEEFVVLLPDIAAAGDVVQIAERIRSAVAENIFGVGGGLRLTCSIGAAWYPEHGFGREELMAVVDGAMYAAKHLGRNQVRRADDPVVHELLNAQKTEGGREEKAMMGTVKALAMLVEKRDQATGTHAQGVADMMKQVALEVGLDEQEAHMLALAGWLHDIGKVAIPDAILRKPGKLDEAEWIIMRTHSEIGAEIVSQVPSLRALAPIIRAHHERWDGTGYPDKAGQDHIPLGARIVAVVDAYTAMTERRPYQRERTSEEALREICCCAGTQFDPAIVEALERLLKKEREGTRVLQMAS